jgi:2,4-dienoyl-CoA reductase-like NADH-dependent reductase (Old Yellow Enzyme family)
MDKIAIQIEAEVNPTESEEKVQKAIWNLLGELPTETKPAQKGSTITAQAKSQEPLITLRNVLHRDHIRDAARKAQRAGFRVVEIHMAHGYLMHEFLSPLSNRRGDGLGGDLAGRMQVPLRVAQAVRQVWPASLPVFVRISATDWVDGGWDLPQSIVLSQKLQQLGVDLIDCSSGGMVPDAKVPAAPGYQIPFAAAIRREAAVATGAVGLISDAQQAEQTLVC